MSLSRRPLYQELASLFDAYKRCVDTNNHEWRDQHHATIEWLVDNYMPSGSGIDGGTKFDWDASKPDKLVFTFGYHHMNDGGYYDGWTEHTLAVKPSLQFGITTHISGRDRNGIKECLYEVYGYALEQDVWQTNDCKWHTEAYEPDCNVVWDGGGI